MIPSVEQRGVEPFPLRRGERHRLSFRTYKGHRHTVVFFVRLRTGSTSRYDYSGICSVCRGRIRIGALYLVGTDFNHFGCGACFSQGEFQPAPPAPSRRAARIVQPVLLTVSEDELRSLREAVARAEKDARTQARDREFAGDFRRTEKIAADSWREMLRVLDAKIAERAERKRRTND